MSRKPTLSDLLRETHVAPALVDRLARAMFNMGVRFPQVATTAFIAAPPASGAETVWMTTPPLNISLDFSQILLFWGGDITTGAGTTSFQTTVRRGTSTAGTQIYQTGQLPVATAGQHAFISGVFADVPGAVAGQQYSVSVTGNGTTGAWAAGGAQAMLAIAL